MDSLPNELIIYISSFLTLRENHKLSLVNKHFNSLTKPVLPYDVYIEENLFGYVNYDKLWDIGMRWQQFYGKELSMEVYKNLTISFLAEYEKIIIFVENPTEEIKNVLLKNNFINNVSKTFKRQNESIVMEKYDTNITFMLKTNHIIYNLMKEFDLLEKIVMPKFHMLKFETKNKNLFQMNIQSRVKQLLDSKPPYQL